MSDLAKGTYSFQLLDQNNNVVQTKTNNENGEIIFDSINYNANDLGFVNYKIKEVIGNDTNINYDIFSLSCIGEGNGNPLQCSCLENPRDGGAWWAAIYGVVQSRTRLKRLSGSSMRHLDLNFLARD